MSKYIDVNLLGECDTCQYYVNRKCTTFCDSGESYSPTISKLPIVDVVEIVRCKNCQHYNKRYHRCNLHSEEPDQYSTGFIFEMQEDDFCSCGERRNDEI